MQKDNQSTFDSNWYDLWAKQAAFFYESAEKHLGDVFADQSKSHPENFEKQINEWMEMLKTNWQPTAEQRRQKQQDAYAQYMFGLFQQASEVMMMAWIKRANDNNPIKNVQQLYELWLESCQEVYQQSIKSDAYQQAYGEFVKTSMKFWQMSR